MYILVGIVSFMAGGLFGVCFMCLFQINRLHGNAKFEKESSKNGGQ